MAYQSRFVHPDHGEMLNKTESAKYLGISRAKFNRIAPAPTIIQDDIYPFWPRRLLDMLPRDEAYDCEKTLAKGRDCGEYLIGELENEEEAIELLRNKLTGIVCSAEPEKVTALILKEYKIPGKFHSAHEAKLFREGILSAIKRFFEERTSK